MYLLKSLLYFLMVVLDDTLLVKKEFRLKNLYKIEKNNRKISFIP